MYATLVSARTTPSSARSAESLVPSAITRTSACARRASIASNSSRARVQRPPLPSLTISRRPAARSATRRTQTRSRWCAGRPVPAAMESPNTTTVRVPAQACTGTSRAASSRASTGRRHAGSLEGDMAWRGARLRGVARPAARIANRGVEAAARARGRGARVIIRLLFSAIPRPWNSLPSACASKTSRSGSIRSGGIFDFDAKVERLEEVTRELESPDVWNKPDVAQALGRERAALEKVVNGIRINSDGLKDARELLELAEMDDDQDTANSVVADVDAIQARVEKLE